MSQGLFSFSRATLTNWRKSEWKEQPITDRWIWNEEKAAHFSRFLSDTSRGMKQEAGMCCRCAGQP